MKRIAALLLCLSLALSVTACGKSQTAENSSRTQDPADSSTETGSQAEESYFEEEAEVVIPENYELKVAFEQDNAPYSYVDDSGALAGFNVDVAKALCDYNGWTLSAQPIEWSERDKVLDEGSVDCVWGAAPYSQVYAQDSSQIWCVYGSIYVDATVLSTSGMLKLDDLKGKTIEAEPGALFAIEGDEATELGKKVAEIAGAVNKVSDVKTAYDHLAAGECDAVLTSGTADNTMEFDEYEDVIFQALYDVDVYSNEDEELSAANGVCDLEIGAAFPEESEIFEAVYQTMDALLSEGTLSGIQEDWRSRDKGAYDAPISRCQLYEGDTIGELLGEDDLDIDLDALSDEDLPELEEGSEDVEAEEPETDSEAELVPEVEPAEESVLVLN